MWACFSVCNWVITKTHSFNDCSKTLCSLINVSLKTKIMKFGERRVHVLQGKTNEITFERKTFYFMNMKISHFFSSLPSSFFHFYLSSFLLCFLFIGLSFQVITVTQRTQSASQSVSIIIYKSKNSVNFGKFHTIHSIYSKHNFH